MIPSYFFLPFFSNLFRLELHGVDINIEDGKTFRSVYNSENIEVLYLGNYKCSIRGVCFYLLMSEDGQRNYNFLRKGSLIESN